MPKYINHEEFQRNKLKLAIEICEKILTENSYIFTDTLYNDCCNKISRELFDGLFSEAVYYVRCVYLLLAFKQKITPILKVVESSRNKFTILTLYVGDTQILYAERCFSNNNIKAVALDIWKYSGILDKLIKRALEVAVIDDRRVQKNSI